MNFLKSMFGDKIGKYFIICILVRLMIVYMVYLILNNNIRYNNNLLLKFSTIILFIIGFSFLLQYLTKIRDVGAFNQDIWWDFLRPIHAYLYILSSYLIYKNDKKAIYFLLLDGIIGILGFINNRLN